MSVVIPTGFAEASYTFTSAEGTPPFVCTLGLDLRPSANPDPVAVANAAFDAWSLHLSPLMDSDLILDRVTLYIGAAGPSGSVDSTLAPKPGGRSGSGLPWSMSAIARKNTGELGRSGKGRMFIPGVVSAAEIGQNGAVSNARRVVINNALEDFWEYLDAALPSGYPPVLFHNSGSSDTTPTPIESFTCAPLVGWIRKRIR